MCNSLWHPSKTQTAPRLKTTGLTSDILQKIKLILGENVVEPSIYTALLLIFPPQLEKNVGVKYVYQKYQVPEWKKRNGIKMALSIFHQPGNSFSKFTLTNSKNIQTKYIELCLSAISFCGCTGVFIFQTIMLKFGLSVE